MHVEPWPAFPEHEQRDTFHDWEDFVDDVSLLMGQGRGTCMLK
jgi:hypothetical protein